MNYLKSALYHGATTLYNGAMVCILAAALLSATGCAVNVVVAPNATVEVGRTTDGMWGKYNGDVALLCAQGAVELTDDPALQDELFNRCVRDQGLTI